MADQPEVNEPNPDRIRQEMAATRSSLADKLETLEKKVTDTVTEATTAVSDTVENVKDTVQSTVENVRGTVQSTVESVKETFNLSRHVEEHPWAMVGSAAALGFLGGLLLGSSSSGKKRSSGTSWGSQEGNRISGALAATSAPEQSQSSSWFGQLFSAFLPQMDRLKSLAVTTLATTAQNLVNEVAGDSVKGTLTDMIHDVATRLGGEQAKNNSEDSSSEQHQANGHTHASVS